MSIKPNTHALGRLNQANTQTFSYDKAGNNQHHNAQYNISNNQLLEDDTFTYSYDKKGNLARKIDKQTQELYIYKYNALNQLVHHYKATAEDTYIYKMEYRYDGLNRRVSKHYIDSIDKTKSFYHRYLYQDENIIAILDENRLADNNSLLSVDSEPKWSEQSEAMKEALLASIVHHPNRTDTPLSITNHTTNQTYYYHRDHQGSIVALTNQEGNIVEHITYDGHYGKILSHTKEEETLNPYGYTGRETDQSDLYYYRARYYDPNTQRFLSSDPIEFEAGDFNFYRYVGNDCVNFVDPTGLYPSSGEMIDVGTAQEAADRALNNRADAMVDRRQRAIDANRGLPPLSKEEARERAETQQENSDDMALAVCSVAAGLALAPVAEAGYMYAMTNPIASYNLSEAMLNGGYTSSALGVTNWAGRIGQGLEMGLKWLTN